MLVVPKQCFHFKPSQSQTKHHTQYSFIWVLTLIKVTAALFAGLQHPARVLRKVDERVKQLRVQVRMTLRDVLL